MESSSQTWQTYEQVSRVVLTDLRRVLGLSDVEGKQELQGVSGATWEIDGKAILMAQGGFLVVEARRHTTAGQKQEALAAVAYRITDLGGQGGIIVSPLPLQAGAQMVAAHENIKHVRLESWSTADNYLAEFMGKNFHRVAVTSSAGFSDHPEATVYRNGKPVDGGT
jgi:hypothetical protein